MPKGKKGLYEKLRTDGYSKRRAAKISQAKAGLALGAGKPPKDKERG